jgi:hypothetical protein
MNDDDVEAYVQRVANKFKREQIVDQKTGNVDMRFNQMAVDQDYFIPVRDPSTPSPIETLPGATNLSEIADIEYIWNGKSMSQKLKLVRKELGKTPEEVRNDPPQQKKPEVKENNPNPGTTASVIPAPNSVYNVGQTYLVQDKSGKLYNLTVTNLLENGIEVTGTLKDSPIGMSSSTTGNTSVVPTGGGTPSVTGGTPSVPPNVDKPFQNATEIKAFQDWLDANYQGGFNYDEALCYRDIGLIIDAMAIDIITGGTYQTIGAG